MSINRDSINNEIKRKLDIQDNLAKKFWSLVQFLWEKFKGDNVPIAVSLWYKAGCTLEIVKPHFNIISTGTLVYKHRDDISNNDIDWVSSIDFDSKMEDWRLMLGGSMQSTLIKIRDYLMVIIQNATNTENKKSAVLEVSKNLLSWYCRYNVLGHEISELKLKLKT
jgi:hypothetical protein